MSSVGTQVGQKSPYTGNTIVKVITINKKTPTKSKTTTSSSSSSSSSSKSSSSSSSSQPSPNTEGSISKLAEQYGGYNKIPQSEYDKVNQQYGTSYTGGTKAVSSNNNNTPTSQPSPNTEGSIAKLAEQYGGYNKIPQSEYDKVNQKYGTSYTGGTTSKSSNNNNQTQQSSPNTEGSISKLAEQYGGYNKIPQSEYDKVNQKYGTSYSGGTTPQARSAEVKLQLKSTQEQQTQQLQAQKQSQELPVYYKNFQTPEQQRNFGPKVSSPESKLQDTAFRLEKKEKQIQEQAKGWKDLVGISKFVDAKEGDSALVATGKALGNTAWGLTGGFLTGTTQASLILTAEKAVFMGRAAVQGASQAIKGDSALLTSVRESSKEQQFAAVDAITPVKVQSLREGKGFEYDPQGTATLITAAVFAGAKTAAYNKKAEVVPSYKTPGTKIVETNKAMLADKSAAVKGAGGIRKSPLSKPQIKQQSYGMSPYKNVNKVRYNQGEFVTKSPKRAGGQESVRFNPQNKEVSVINKKPISKDVGSLQTKTTFKQGGQVTQEMTFVPKGPAKSIGNKGFARPPSQVQTIKPVQSGNSGLNQIQKQIQKTSFEQTKYIKPPKETSVITKRPTPSQNQNSILQVKKTTQSTPPMQKVSTDGRASVRAKLIQKLQEQKAQRDLTLRQQRESTQRDFSSNVDLSKVKFLQEKAPVQPKVTPKPPTSLEVLERPGAVAPKSQYSTEAMYIEPRNIQFLKTYNSLGESNIKLPTSEIDNGIKVAPEPKYDVTNRTDNSNKTDIKPIQDVVQDNETALKPISITRIGGGGKSNSPSKPPSPVQPPPPSIIKPVREIKPPTPPPPNNPFKTGKGKEPPKIPPPKFEFKSPSFKRQEKQAGFNVITRIGGREVIATSKPLTKDQAMNFGQFLVGTTARASFKVVSAGTSATGTFYGRGKPETFKQGKDDWIVEKNKYRISSPGEKREITYKGMFASKNKKKSKSIFG